MTERLLDNINQPDDVKKLSRKQLATLAQEIRDYLVEICSMHGGHLGSNLGVVELTLAMHYVFDSPQDKFLFDVSHQGYVHKILTGRKEFLKTLRQTDGCSGFLQREESEHDHFGAGHAGTAYSAGLGFAAARDHKKTGDHVISVVGDGAFGCGVSLEALNNTVETTDKMIVVLNDNKMSISPNVGAMSKYFNRIISDQRYTSFKDQVGEVILKIPRLGERIIQGLQRVDEAVKSIVAPGAIFEELGLKYYGPIDGHDLDELIDLFENAKTNSKPVLLHVLTEKGRGFDAANLDPEKCHGFKKVTEMDKKESEPIQKKITGPSFSEVFGKHLITMAKADERVVSISAGMLSGTGMNHFHKEMPDRVYDTGIAEEHATVFSGGLAAGGMRPVVGIYATFMHRALDCVFHDICLQELPVIFCMDRAGLVEDGPTHHGIQDIAFWNSLPNINIFQPRDATELREMMDFALTIKNEAVMIRYAKADSSDIEVSRAELELGKSELIKDGSDVAIWTYGREVNTALEVAESLAEQGVNAKIVNARFIKPFDKDALVADAAQMPVVVLEDHMADSGMSSIVANILIDHPNKGLLRKAYPTDIIRWGKTKDLRDKLRMNTPQISEDILKFLGK